MTKIKLTLPKAIPYILIIAGLLGLMSAFVLTVDKFKILENPSYIPSCNLNPIVSCGSVMNSKQGAVFGFPNPFIGLITYAVLVTTGVAMLAGATFKRWYWIGLEIGAVLGVAFIHWLFFESVYRIHALCPYCMVAWVATITGFWYVTLYNIDQQYIKLPNKLKPLYKMVRKHHLDILILWFLVITALILKHFWYYFGKHL